MEKYMYDIDDVLQASGKGIHQNIEVTENSKDDVSSSKNRKKVKLDKLTLKIRKSV